MLKLNLSNGKLIVIGANHIMAMLSSGSGDGSNIVLGGGVSYDVTQKTEEILEMIEALEAKKRAPAPQAAPVKRPATQAAPATPAAPAKTQMRPPATKPA